MNITWPKGLGAVLALLGLIIVVVLLVVGQMAIMPIGLLFLLAFLSRLV